MCAPHTACDSTLKVICAWCAWEWCTPKRGIRTVENSCGRPPLYMLNFKNYLLIKHQALCVAPFKHRAPSQGWCGTVRRISKPPRCLPRRQSLWLSVYSCLGWCFEWAEMDYHYSLLNKIGRFPRYPLLAWRPTVSMLMMSTSTMKIRTTWELYCPRQQQYSRIGFTLLTKTRLILNLCALLERAR